VDPCKKCILNNSKIGQGYFIAALVVERDSLQSLTEPMERKLLIDQFRALIKSGRNSIQLNILLVINHIQFFISKETDLNDVALTDELLECFLNARKNNLNRAFDLVKF